MDIRGEHNYVAAPPSIHKSGNKYEWFGVNTPVLGAPLWLLREIAARQELKYGAVSSNPIQSVKDSSIIAEGNRNDFLCRYIRGLINGRTEEQVLSIALATNESMFDPPLKPRQVEYQVSRLYKKYSKRGDMGLLK